MRKQSVTRFARSLTLGAGLVGLCAVYATAQTELATGPFTASQSAEGRKTFMARCAACHKANLQGQGEALPLAGRQFMAGWVNRTSQDLYNLIHASMPAGAPNSLDDETYANLTAFILHANGARPGPTAFLRAPPLRIGSIANGIAPGDLDLSDPASVPVVPPSVPGRGGL
jgi:mono/diheme cytochrome c family protein